MKQPLHVLLLVCIAAALAGWGLAWVGAAHRERESAAQELLAKQAEPERLAKGFGRLIGEADEVEIVFSESPRERKIEFRDPAWIARLSGIVGGSSFTPMGQMLMVSSPRIIFYRNKVEIGELMIFRKALRAYAGENGGDFIVERDTILAIDALLHEKETNPEEAEVAVIRE